MLELSRSEWHGHEKAICLKPEIKLMVFFKTLITSPRSLSSCALAQALKRLPSCLPEARRIASDVSEPSAMHCSDITELPANQRRRPPPPLAVSFRPCRLMRALTSKWIGAFKMKIGPSVGATFISSNPSRPDTLAPVASSRSAGKPLPPWLRNGDSSHQVRPSPAGGPGGSALRKHDRPSLRAT